MVRLTVVNESRALLEVIGDILAGGRYCTTLIEGVDDEVVARIGRSRPDVLMIDLAAGEDADGGWEIVREIRTIAGCEHVLVLLTTADIASLADAPLGRETAEGVAILQLPFAIDSLQTSLETLMNRQEATECSSDPT
jgi:CheY-like chemotaxis protein